MSHFHMDLSIVMNILKNRAACIFHTVSHKQKSKMQQARVGLSERIYDRNDIYFQAVNTMWVQRRQSLPGENETQT